MDTSEYFAVAYRLLTHGNYREAEILYREILDTNPDDVNALHFLGVVYHHLERDDLAVTHIQKAVRLQPNYADARINLGIVYQATGRLDEAREEYEHAIRLDPTSALAWYNLANLHREQKKPKEAIDCYSRALEFDPRLVDAYVQLGNIFRDIGQSALAIKCYQQALHVKPDAVEVINSIGATLDTQYRLTEAETYFRKAVEINPSQAQSYSCLLMNLCYSGRYDVETVFVEHRKFGEFFEKGYRPRKHANDRTPDRRLRIGYVSPDLRKHSVAYFVEPVLMSHAKEEVEIFCYANQSPGDEVTERLKSYADQWRVIYGMDDARVFEIVQADRIDILVDLAGHTALNRLTLFAMKPAPVQASWIGYPATTGLETIDYRVTDALVDPPGKTERFYSEELMRLPECFLCYLPDPESPDVRALPLLTSRTITFGSFNNLSKITPRMFSLWAELLRALPDSTLVLKTVAFVDETARRRVSDLLIGSGVSPERFRLLPWTTSTREHLDTYNQIDIALDTFPYNGTTTTCEALWMGVPVVTLAGAGYGARVGASLLSNVGLSDLVATTEEEYRRICLSLARDVDRLTILRTGLREMMRNSPLMDAARFTRNLERCYRDMWRVWCCSKK